MRRPQYSRQDFSTHAKTSVLATRHQHSCKDSSTRDRTSTPMRKPQYLRHDINTHAKTSVLASRHQHFYEDFSTRDKTSALMRRPQYLRQDINTHAKTPVLATGHQHPCENLSTCDMTSTLMRRPQYSRQDVSTCNKTIFKLRSTDLHVPFILFWVHLTSLIEGLRIELELSASDAYVNIISRAIKRQYFNHVRGSH